MTVLGLMALAYSFGYVLRGLGRRQELGYDQDAREQDGQRPIHR